MTEEIIIDGVDVSGCKFRLVRDNKQKCECCHATGFGVICNCESWHDCYYKQLKRLEKEVKHWQTEHREAKAKGEWTYDLVRKKADSLKQENKDLKKQIESDKGLITVGGKQQYQYLQRIDELEQENKRLKERQINWYNAEAQNYRSALEEILESAKFAQCLPCGSVNLEDCLNCNDDTTNNGQFCMEKRIHDIKTKCVEVLNEDK